MRHLDLFSGIGGFALAAQTVWGKEYENIGFCDNNKFCQQVLKKHWPNSPIYDDIQTLTNSRGQRRQQESGSSSSDESPHEGRLKKNYNQPTSYDKSTQFIADAARQRSAEDGRNSGRSAQRSTGGDPSPLLVTGGFPCQPFSAAGRRKGTADDRHLWPEMFRVIREFAPLWIVAENVRGLATWNDGLVLEQVCADLEGEGYEVQPFIIPAVAINAPHRRDRIWFVANRTGDRRSRQVTASSSQEGHATRSEQTRQLARRSQGSYSNAPDAESAERELSRTVQDGTPRGCADQSWERSWIEVATELCGMDDGLPAELDGFKLSKSAHRRERLKSLGNAIVPQVAIEIFKAIKLCNF